MKKKDLKVLAKKIAEAEEIIQNSTDSKAIHQAQETILELSGKSKLSMEDMLIVDEMVQEILSQKN